MQIDLRVVIEKLNGALSERQLDCAVKDAYIDQLQARIAELEGREEHKGDA